MPTTCHRMITPSGFLFATHLTRLKTHHYWAHSSFAASCHWYWISALFRLKSLEYKIVNGVHIKKMCLHQHSARWVSLTPWIHCELWPEKYSDRLLISLSVRLSLTPRVPNSLTARTAFCWTACICDTSLILVNFWIFNVFLCESFLSFAGLWRKKKHQIDQAQDWHRLLSYPELPASDREDRLTLTKMKNYDLHLSKLPP